MTEPATGSLLKPNNATVWKGMAGIGVVVALVGALVVPMQQRISDLQTERVEHRTLGAHPQALVQLGEMRVQFTEVETQFRNLDERTRRMETQIQVRIELASAILQAEIAVLKERLQHLLEER